ncbi:membrane-bound lytic murein transglycosylase B [Desulfovibrionales bacterium]
MGLAFLLSLTLLLGPVKWPTASQNFPSAINANQPKNGWKDEPKSLLSEEGASLPMPSTTTSAAPSSPYAFLGAIPLPWRPLASHLAANGLPSESLAGLFSQSALSYDPSFMGRKLRALYKSRFLSSPTNIHVEPRRKVNYYEAFLPPLKLVEVHLFSLEHAVLLDQVWKHYGIPPKLIIAFLIIETRLGDYLGEQQAFTSLASLAATTDLEAVAPWLADLPITLEQRTWLAEREIAKAAEAYLQLKALLCFADHNHLNPLAIPGSIYGAFGLCQFMPTTALSLAVDGDNDGHIDLFGVPDAVFSIGNFLKQAGWKPGLSHKEQLAVVHRYNHDDTYAQAVLAIAGLI